MHLNGLLFSLLEKMLLEYPVSYLKLKMSQILSILPEVMINKVTELHVFQFGL